MNTVIHHAASLAAGLVVAQLPRMSNESRIALSVVTAELVRSGLGSLRAASERAQALTARFQAKVLVVTRNGADPNYRRLEEYVLRRHSQRFQQLQLVPRNGRTQLSLNRAVARASIDETFGGHRLTLLCESDGIHIRSWSADVDTLRQYVEHVAREMRQLATKTLKIYRIAGGAGAEARPFKRARRGDAEEDDEDEWAGGARACAPLHWEDVVCTTNKSMANTIVAREVEAALYEGVRRFLDPETEAEYARKGLPYQCGFLLHGPPGAGKSSCIKALALEFNLPVFALNLNSVHTDGQLDALVTSMLSHARNSGYIVILEDVDRTRFMQQNVDVSRPAGDGAPARNGGARARPGGRGAEAPEEGAPPPLPPPGLGVGALINFLDGVVEAHKRIVILTANNRAILERFPVMLRPGRVDAVVEIGFCTADQMRRMALIFFPEAEIDEARIHVPAELSPAHFSKLLRQLPDGDAQALENLLYHGNSQSGREAFERERAAEREAARAAEAERAGREAREDARHTLRQRANAMRTKLSAVQRNVRELRGKRAAVKRHLQNPEALDAKLQKASAALKQQRRRQKELQEQLKKLDSTC